MQTIQVQVTAEHIAKGRRGSCGACPTALAILEHLPEQATVHVGSMDMDIFDGNDSFYVLTPYEASRFIMDFDAGLLSAPFTFPLEIPDFVQLAAPVGSGEVVDGG